MFCAKCGTQYEGGQFCPSCGAPNEAVPQQPAQPVYQPEYQQPVYQAPVRQPVQIQPATTYQKKMAVVIALISVFALFIGLGHLFCMVDLPMSVDVEMDTRSILGSSMGGYGYGYDDYDDYYDYDDFDDFYDMDSMVPAIELDGSIGAGYVSPSILSELFDLLDTASQGIIDASFTMGYVGLILFGLINLLIAAVGILYYLRARMNNGLYDKIFGSMIKAKSPALILGLAGVVACLLQIVCMWFTGFNYEMMGQSVGISVGVHWITWIALIAYGALAGSQLLAIDKPEEE